MISSKSILFLLLLPTIYTFTPNFLQRYEQRLNAAMMKKQGSGPRTVKRYKCVEEYVTLDSFGKTVESYQGQKFTTTTKPPSYRTTVEHDIRRKPARKVTIALNNKHQNDDEFEKQKTPPVPSTTEAQTTTTETKPLDELNDEEADRIIEEMYLKKKEENRVTEPPSQLMEPVTEHPVLLSTQQKIEQTTAEPTPTLYNPIRAQKAPSGGYSKDDYDEYAPPGARAGGVRNMPYDEEQFEEYEDVSFYRPYRRPLRNHRRRPLIYNDEFSDEQLFDRGSPRRQITRDLSPLRSLKNLRHKNWHSRTLPVHHSPPTAPLSGGVPLPAATLQSPPQSSLNHPMALAPPAVHMRAQQQNPVPLAAAPPVQPPAVVPQQPPQQLPQANSVTIGGEVLKMKPIVQSNAQEMQEATEESCSKIKKMATSFGIKDVSTWARGNCSFLQLYAPTATCELIYHFIDSCKNRKFFK